MAKAIRQINKHVPTQEEEQTRAFGELIKALTDNHEAIIKTLDIVKILNEMGALDTINGLLEKRTDVGVIAIGQLNQPAMYNTIKNGMKALNFLSSVNPEQIQTILNGVSTGLDRSTESIKKGEKQSLWKLGKIMRSPEAQASMGMMAEFLKGMGEAFQKDQEKAE
ncbi:DUF1641 domain-containing protein [Metabacillus sp. RGM 3146]|uniref:DUF1641 domain-containing protein n=1 Tax=Metabacillus sp. RGM 3146 TaxID=3401092 RepID=UPI003B9A8460